MLNKGIDLCAWRAGGDDEGHLSGDRRTPQRFGRHAGQDQRAEPHHQAG